MAFYFLFLASLIAPTIGIPLTILIFLIVIVGVIALSNSVENKNGNENETNINENEKKTVGNENISNRENTVPKVQIEKKSIEKSKPDVVKKNIPPEEKKQKQTKNLSSTTVKKATTKSSQQEPKSLEMPQKKEVVSDTLTQKALFLYDDFLEVQQRVIDIDQIITRTQKEEIVWYEGDNNRVIAWVADYQNGLLVLYKDLVKKKYKFIYFEERLGSVQKLTKVTELRKAIEVQIDNRRINKETVPAVGFLVRTNTFKCIRNHGIEDIIAVFRVLNSQGRIIQVEAPAAKCEKCKVYYIHEYIFQKIMTYGTPLCQVISEKQYLNGSYLKMNPGMAQKSLLKICGYSVNAAEGLTDQDRQRILESIVENGIMTRHEIIQYLNYFITMRKNQSRDMSEAIRKWKKDINFVENMRLTGVSSYEVRTVYRIEK